MDALRVLEIPPLTAETSKSELSKKMPISCQGGSDAPSSDAHDEDAELFSNSGSSEEYQPSFFLFPANIFLRSEVCP